MLDDGRGTLDGEGDTLAAGGRLAGGEDTLDDAGATLGGAALLGVGAPALLGELAGSLDGTGTGLLGCGEALEGGTGVLLEGSGVGDGEGVALAGTDTGCSTGGSLASWSNATIDVAMLFDGADVTVTMSPIVELPSSLTGPLSGSQARSGWIGAPTCAVTVGKELR